MESATMQTTQAIVAYPPLEPLTPNWSLHPILVPTPSSLQPNDLLIQLHATGICHTDIVTTARSTTQGSIYPIVAGHEGAGYIRAIGPACRKKGLKIGDPVLLSFVSCEKCHYCSVDEGRKRNSCESFLATNISGERDVFRMEDGEGVVGKYFGQSSFAQLSVVKEAAVLPVRGLVNDEELKLFAPLGCGLQTGAGAVVNTASTTASDMVMVLGLGGVGLAAVMAAGVVGCKSIIAVDRVPSRLALAKEVGATHALDTTGIPLEDLPAAMRKVTPNGLGPTVCIETTGAVAVVKAAYQALANSGRLVFVGGPADPTTEFNFNIVDLLGRSIKLFGCVEGDSHPEEFIPKLIQWYREGKFPLEKMMKYYRVEDFQRAVHDMHTGETIKPVLLW